MGKWFIKWHWDFDEKTQHETIIKGTSIVEAAREFRNKTIALHPAAATRYIDQDNIRISESIEIQDPQISTQTPRPYRRKTYAT